MNGFLSPNCKIISVLITPSNNATSSSYIFPTQQELQDRKIVAIEAYCGGTATHNSADILNDPLNPAISVLSDLLFQNGFLTLYTSAVRNDTAFAKHQESGLFYDKIPLCRLRPVQSGFVAQVPAASTARGSIFMIRPTELSFNKCKVEFPTPVAMDGQYSAVFVFHYLDKGDDGSQWMRSMGYDTGNHK